MPLYFLHVHDGVIARDPEGIDLTDLAAAREEAIAGLRVIIAQAVIGGTVFTHVHIVIADGDDELIDKVGFEDAVMLVGESRP